MKLYNEPNVGHSLTLAFKSSRPFKKSGEPDFSERSQEKLSAPLPLIGGRI